LLTLAAGIGWLHGQPSTPGAPIACGAGVSILLAGKPIQSGCVLNLVTGTGVIATAAPNPAINGTDISFSFNVGLIPTHTQAQNFEGVCVSSNGTRLYACALPNLALPAYSNGMLLSFYADVPCTVACTLDALGSQQGGAGPGLTIFQQSGLNSAAVAAGWHLLVYDAGIPVFRLLI
jgi:hypothetical protein